MSSWRIVWRPGALPTSIRSAPGGARSSSSAADSRSCTTTSARRQQLRAPHRDQPGVAGPGAHEVHGHPGSVRPTPAPEPDSACGSSPDRENARRNEGWGTLPAVFERFTDDARRVVVLAQEEARLLDHNWIGTEHLLLAVIHQGGVVAEALEPFGLTLDRVRAEVELRTIPQGAHGGHIPFTDHAKKAMERSLREALKLGDRSITSVHLMLGVLEVEGCLGLQIVADVSDDVDEIKSWLKENRRIRTETDDSGRDGAHRRADVVPDRDRRGASGVEA